MSLSAVRNQPRDQFGYFNVSYTGKIEFIDPRDLNKYRDIAAENGNVFLAQNNRLADNAIFPARTMAGKEGSLIVASHASEAERILDVTFGVPALERATKVIAFHQSKDAELKSTTSLAQAFGQSADKYPILRDFSLAARAPVATGVDRAPSQEMMLAA